jgi:transposase
MRLPTAALPLSDSHREVLEALARSGVSTHRDVQRARALLLAGDGQPNTHIGARVGVSPSTVKAWRERFSQDGLKEFGVVRPGRGRKPSIAAEKVAGIVHATLHENLRTIDREVPNGLQVHLILDNYSTHKHDAVKKWLAKHPRFHLHFTPTSSSWLNLIERWFGKLTDKAIRRGIFHSVPELINAIETYLTVNNENPQPFTWTATTEQILTKVQRGRIALQQNTTQN